MNENFATCLNNHVIFKELSETLGESVNKWKCQRLITCRNDVLYIWNGLNQCVDSVCMKEILKGEEWSSEYVSLVATPSVCFDVEEISVNCTSSLLALVGAGGVAVMKLPDRWLCRERRVEITATSLAQRVFLMEHHVLRRARWHPYSPTDSHLVLLSSDEKLRLYSAVDECLLWEVALSAHSVRRSLPSKLSIGETPVDFDFGPCDDQADDVHPVFVVWGNGDVYSVDTKLEEDHAAKLQGPFRVSPAADDNYGSDASSIAVLETSPPSVVIATSNGLLYHCLLFADESSRDVKVLHVVERVELELGLPLGGDTADTDIVSCPISLERDPHINSRYFCLHSAGIHCVVLPLVSGLQEFARTGKLTCLSRVQSHTDYLLCTAVTTGSDPMVCSPTLGVAFLDFTKMLVLLSNGKLLNLPLPPAHCDESRTPDDIPVINTVKTQDNFQFLIENLLKDGGISSCPLIKLPTTATRPQDWLEIVLKATQSYRAVLKTHSDVALKIQQKTHQLKSTLNRQIEDLDKLNDDKAGLRSTAEQIAEKYEEINEKQTEIIKRSERLLLKIECSTDRLEGVNEKKMANILEKAKAKIALLERDINAVQSFYSRLEAETKQPDEKEIHFGPKTQMLYKNLKHLAGEISDLTGRVKTAQQTVTACYFQQ